MPLFKVKSTSFPDVGELLIAADDGFEAMDWFGRIVGITLNASARAVCPSDEDDAVRNVERWWGNYCDRADGNASIDDAEFDAVLDRMECTFHAIYNGGA